MSGEKDYAVLVPFVRTEEGWGILMEVRSAWVRQPGEICLPGGGMEEGETPEACALREMEEELGIPASAVEVLGALPEERMGDGRRIFPVAGKAGIPSLQSLSPNPGEVDSTFLLPLSFLLQTRPRYFPYRESGAGEELPERLWAYLSHYGSLPAGIGTFYWEYGDHGIWGLTARILEKLRRTGDLQGFEEGTIPWNCSG